MGTNGGSFVANIDLIAAAIENVDLGQLDTIRGLGLQSNLKLLLTVLEHLITRRQLPLRLVVRQALADQP